MNIEQLQIEVHMGASGKNNAENLFESFYQHGNMSVFIICPIVSLQQFFCTQRLELLNFEVA
jgi:hypothetical protein